MGEGDKNKETKNDVEISWEDIVDYQDFIEIQCKKRYSTISNNDLSLSIEDLIQEVSLHIYEKKEDYDPDKGSKGTFIRWMTHQKLHMISNKSDRHKKRMDRVQEEFIQKNSNEINNKDILNKEYKDDNE
jgi:DNA-directed RNA polymerase specialized sigma24 family protein